MDDFATALGAAVGVCSFIPTADPRPRQAEGGGLVEKRFSHRHLHVRAGRLLSANNLSIVPGICFATARIATITLRHSPGRALERRDICDLEHAFRFDRDRDRNFASYIAKMPTRQR